jgi:hypothetical protein
MERRGNGGNWGSQASSTATVCDFASAGTVSLANVAGAAKVVSLTPVPDDIAMTLNARDAK